VLFRSLGKIAVRAGVCDGFIGNRILMIQRRAVEYLLEDGATPAEVDAALRSFGFAMGPFEVSDLAGLDIAWAARKRRAPDRPPEERYVAIADHLCERGWFGRKAGRGWYRYGAKAKPGEDDPQVLALIDAARREKGITPHAFTPDQIIDRTLLAIINEAARIVEEGIALRPLDVDVVMLNGYGFPRHVGGPMHAADARGLDRVLADLTALAEDDAYFWTPAPLIERLAREGRSFADLNLTGEG